MASLLLQVPAKLVHAVRDAVVRGQRARGVLAYGCCEHAERHERRRASAKEHARDARPAAKLVRHGARKSTDLVPAVLYETTGSSSGRAALAIIDAEEGTRSSQEVARR